MHKYSCELIVDGAINEVFDFFNKPENLVKLMPNFMSFQLLTPQPLIMKEGAVFDYVVSIFGIKQRWTTYINHYNPPNNFSDIQLKGPNSYWHHTHQFISSDNGTIVRDKIEYMLPFGFLGKIANALVMKWIISKLFSHRKKVVSEIFGLNE